MDSEGLRKRRHVGRPRVEELGKIDPAELRAILVVGATVADVARFFGISLATAERVIQRAPFAAVVRKARAERKLSIRRAQTQLAKKAGVDLTAVKDIFIYGNHSPTMFPAFAHATIDGKPVTSVITDTAWLQGLFCETVGKRGAAVIAARGASSAASAANALVDHVRSLVTPGAIHSVAVKSNGLYGFDANVWASIEDETGLTLEQAKAAVDTLIGAGLLTAVGQPTHERLVARAVI